MVVIPIILCGGAGSRLWPLSREHYPKQLLSLVDDHSLLQNTATRISGVADVAAPILVCNENHRFLIAEQMREIKILPSAIMLEPVGRNTAPAVALAALQAVQQDSDAIIVVLPSDHVITDQQAFATSLTVAVELAEQGKLVTFGVEPTGPETGYGYIKAGEPLLGARQVIEFVEKPNLETAKDYVATGDYYWNSGMFVFNAARYMEELNQHRPDIDQAVRNAFEKSTKDIDFVRPDEMAFTQCPSESIDYAVMEETDAAAVVPLDAGWSDIGSWDALWQISEKDSDQNTLIGDVIVDDVSASYVHAEHRLVSVVGLSEVIVVETADAVMIASQDHAQNVKNIVLSLKSSEREEQMTHRKVYRPWGYYEGIDGKERYQVKLIEVNPGASLSLQMHHHRAEHWVVVSGTAQVTKGEEVFQLCENESTYIPIGVTHRLENRGRIPLRIIEVQSGSYLGEDDIVRFEDNYGRSQ